MFRAIAESLRRRSRHRARRYQCWSLHPLLQRLLGHCQQLPADRSSSSRRSTKSGGCSRCRLDELPSKRPTSSTCWYEPARSSQAAWRSLATRSSAGIAPAGARPAAGARRPSSPRNSSCCTRFACECAKRRARTREVLTRKLYKMFAADMPARLTSVNERQRMTRIVTMCRRVLRRLRNRCHKPPILWIKVHPNSNLVAPANSLACGLLLVLRSRRMSLLDLLPTEEI